MIYRSKTGRYSLPAIVNTTTETIYEESVRRGFMDPLTDHDNVHLTVLTGGRPGGRLPDTDPNLPQAPPGGTYQESNIPWAGEMEGDWKYEDQPPGTWAWPNLHR